MISSYISVYVRKTYSLLIPNDSFSGYSNLNGNLFYFSAWNTAWFALLPLQFLLKNELLFRRIWLYKRFSPSPTHSFHSPVPLFILGMLVVRWCEEVHSGHDCLGFWTPALPGYPHLLKYLENSAIISPNWISMYSAYILVPCFLLRTDEFHLLFVSHRSCVSSS